MIHLTRLNQIPFVVNSDLIEQIETTPDTVITLTTGQKFMVREDVEEVIQRVVQFRRSLLAVLPQQQALCQMAQAQSKLSSDDSQEPVKEFGQ